jgi:hypothetical protein
MYSHAELTVIGITYLDMLENYMMLQLQQYMAKGFIFQQGDAPPNFHRQVTAYVTHAILVCIGRGRLICLYWTRQTDNMATTVIRHASRLLLVWIHHRCCVLPLPTALYQLYARITDATAEDDADMLRWTWNEIAYQWDICQVTQGSYIKHL